MWGRTQAPRRSVKHDDGAGAAGQRPPITVQADDARRRASSNRTAPAGRLASRRVLEARGAVHRDPRWQKDTMPHQAHPGFMGAHRSRPPHPPLARKGRCRSAACHRLASMAESDVPARAAGVRSPTRRRPQGRQAEQGPGATRTRLPNLPRPRVRAPRVRNRERPRARRDGARLGACGCRSDRHGGLGCSWSRETSDHCPRASQKACKQVLRPLAPN
jgi:hypothetical protein